MDALRGVFTLSARRSSYAPITRRGTIVVEGLAASCYALIGSHDLAHVVMTSLRVIYDVTNIFTSSSIIDDDSIKEVHWYAEILMKVVHYMLPRNMLLWLTDGIEYTL